ncbi:MAG: dTMP kinase [Planctomycetota bacterium]|nr:dTMP kinase [Planctomycetota bacterium]
MKSSPSFYVVFEGIDGAGKSSQIQRLAHFLKDELGDKRPILKTFEPTGGSFGQEIRRRAKAGPVMSAQEELDLFVQDRREHVEETLAPALKAKKIILQDRSFYSTVAYQGSRPELGQSLEDLLQVNDFAPKPDLVVLLDLPAEIGLKRVKQRGQADAFEQVERQRKVRENFLELADERFLTVDATLSEEEIAHVVAARVSEMLKDKL